MSSSDPVPALLAAIDAAIRGALSPVVGRVRALETAAAGLEALEGTIASLRGAAAVPGPPGDAGPPGPPAPDPAWACEYDGERGITFRWTGPAGALEARTVTIPAMIYRGVHVPGRLYERGDCVTVDGSIFHCDRDTTARPGSGSGDWTLAVKRGKDARS